MDRFLQGRLPVLLELLLRAHISLMFPSVRPSYLAPSAQHHFLFAVEPTNTGRRRGRFRLSRVSGTGVLHEGMEGEGFVCFSLPAKRRHTPKGEHNGRQQTPPRGHRGSTRTGRSSVET